MSKNWRGRSLDSLGTIVNLILSTTTQKGLKKVSLFSGLNNPTDITLDAHYATICGYTEAEMTEVFAEHLKDKPLEEIRKWYNGYSWLSEMVYNPFSVLNYLRLGEFRNYRFESGTPEFLLKLFLNERNIVRFEVVRGSVPAGLHHHYPAGGRMSENVQYVRQLFIGGMNS